MSEYDEDTARTVDVCRFVPPMKDGFQMVRPGANVDPKALSAMDSAEFSEPEPVPTVMDNMRVEHSQHQAVQDMMSGSPRLRPVPEDQLVTGGPAAVTIPAAKHKLGEVPVEKHPEAIEFPEERKQIVIEEPEPVATSPEPSPEEKPGRSEKQKAQAARLAAANKARAEARRKAKSEESAPAEEAPKETSEEDIF